MSSATVSRPSNEFIESVKKVYCRRAEMWIRFVFGIGGIVLFAMSPVLGGMLYRFWRWLGVITEIGFVGATIISCFLGIVAIISVIMAFDGSVAKDWARDWVEQK